MNIIPALVRCIAVVGLTGMAINYRLSAADNSAEEAVVTESTIIADAHTAVIKDNEAAVNAQLNGNAKGELAGKPTSVTLARRTAAVCGWLLNDNEYGRAMKLAEKVIKQLSKMEEGSPNDKAERLYWEAWLEAKVLDHKVRAIELLKSAEILTPKDERITNLELDLVAAVSEFGR